MNNKDNYIELVKQAQLGSEQSMNCLAKLARERLYVYVRRLVHADDLAQDILQDSILEMFRSINKLKSADKFWPWMFRIAGNKVNTHFKNEQRRKTVSLSEADFDGFQEDVAEMVTKELQQSVSAAMYKLKPQQQKVLFLRCYEELKYSEIAEILGCSTIGAQMRFLRAKKALSKQLSRSGFSKESMMMALVLFAKMTAPSKAVAANVTVAAATTKVGLAASMAALAASKTAVVSLIGAALLTGGVMLKTSDIAKPTAVCGESFIKSEITPDVSQSASGSGKCYYYYPSRSDGAVMLRVESNDNDKQYSLCLQNDKANYYNRGNTVYIENYRLWHDDLAVWQLPTDDAQLTRFLSNLQSRSQDFEHVHNNGEGLLVIANRDEDNNLSQVTHRCNVLDKEFFRYDWPKGARVVDNRDQMHKRGWAYFKIAGQVNGKKVRAAGRVPFVYATSYEYYPWLNFKIAGSRIADAESFAGLLRPWAGLHTIDTVRRDAARQGISFETRLLPDNSKAEVELTYGQSRLVYIIDMKVDVIDEIKFLSQSGRLIGQLEFSYMQDIDIAGDKFAQPRRNNYRRSSQKSSNMLWLFRLLK